MEAIILAGGLGTRLRDVVSDVPKVMAPVNGRPFLSYLLDYLLKNGINHVVLAVGYKSECIKEYFTNKYNGILITYSIEETPLGTGGATKKAMGFCHDEDIFMLNGDTYFDVDLRMMKVYHERSLSTLTIAVKELSNYDRYGSVVVKDNMITKFIEKKPTEYGKVNGGIYCFKKKILYSIKEESFSFEEMILQNRLVDIYAYESKGYFIDIGVPDDYYKSQRELVR